MDGSKQDSHPWIRELLQKARDAKKSKIRNSNPVGTVGPALASKYKPPIMLDAAWDSDYHSGHRNGTG